MKSKNGTVRHHRPPYDCIALLLQGGGALGAYQPGVYQALAEQGIELDWVAGISIGAINAALIAGNAPAVRIERLKEFWEAVTMPVPWQWADYLTPAMIRGDVARDFVNRVNAFDAMTSGVPAFYSPRIPPAWLQPAGTIEATSYYDTRDLRATLERLVDFERLNSGAMRFSVGAVNVASGNFVYFDNRTQRIGPEHILASCALPPGFPAVEIDGQYYWDGGLVSNTPLQWVLQHGPRQDTLAFQVDLWSARGEFPPSLANVATRQKEIMFSSRTRENVDQFVETQQLRHAVSKLLTKLPPELRNDEEAHFLKKFGDDKVYRIVHLICRAKRYEGESKDYEFSRLSMQEHWQAGYNDAIRTLRTQGALDRPTNIEGVATFDIGNS
ncbi:patatin-like phospholipase family protein [Lacibacterium aquatile]|uniref:Patatin-like phospholipase family protein n=1 Tax=Lacibacterium aquatile TaxID=1168082 RepID=A0ABW5DSL5_9PROT